MTAIVTVSGLGGGLGQATTVSGLTIASAERQSRQMRDSPIQGRKSPRYAYAALSS
jgi:hypothetical protein